MGKSIEDALRDHLVDEMEVSPPPADDDLLIEKGFVLSVRLLDLVGFIETEFEIELRPRDVSADNMASIATIAAMIRSRQVES